MQNIKSKISPSKILRNIVLAVFILIALVYLISNIVFWYIGMPERFFKYELTENDTVQINYYTGPFFLLNIPCTIEGKPVTSIGSRLFEETLFDNEKIVDTKLNRMQRYVTAVHLPDTVEEIHFAAFEDCSSLSSINIPPKLSFTGWHILAGTRVRRLVFPEGITGIGCGYDIDLGYNQCCETFSDMKYLREVVFPESLKKIGNNAFLRCTALIKIKIPDSVEEIAYGAFQNSGLTEANIPKSLVGDCGGIFRGTPFERSLEKNAPGGFVVFNDVLLYKYSGDDENVVIPDGIETICARAFWTGKKIKTVEIPESVKYIKQAFPYSSIESLVIPDTVDTESGISFYECYDLKKIVLPDKMRKIEDFAFGNCISLESIDLPKNAKIIGSGAFSGCRSLKDITIPDSVEEIRDEAFIRCSALEEVVFPERLKKIGKNAFENCTALKSLTLPDEIEEINENTFKGCSSLEEVNFPENLKKIDERAFSDCNCLEKIIIPEGVEEINNRAFVSCSSLNEVIIEGSPKIDEYAFGGCYSLKEVTIEGSPEIDENAFEDSHIVYTNFPQ